MASLLDLASCFIFGRLFYELYMLPCFGFLTRTPEDTGNRCFCAVKFEDVFAELPWTPLVEVVHVEDGDVVLRASSTGLLRDTIQRMRLINRHAQTYHLCHHPSWNVDLCGNGTCRGKWCFARSYSVSRSMCVASEDVDRLRSVGSQQYEDASYYAYERRVPFAESSETISATIGDDPCPREGVYRSQACDRKPWGEFVSLQETEISAGMGVCLQRKCYHFRDLASLMYHTSAESPGGIRVPHTQEYLSPSESFEFHALFQMGTLIPCTGCKFDGVRASLGTMIGTVQRAPCVNAHGLERFDQDDAWQQDDLPFWPSGSNDFV
eukprot:TRINITY_DN3828_c0_g2_i1.p1 TRINITY_DN3828_c0_g2~~TRINITY_DN3828_c0_g2_i1.p1  ORF type:complete len:323 (+),score=25.01 TRINITY_DN3828_c0_g2_i1:64-1032(+)